MPLGTNYVRKIEFNELRTIQLAILDDFHRFCQENGIRYSLCGGTLLGAVRHQGYIPWDDDIDIMMPRQDYERFIRTYTSTENAVVDLRGIDTTREVFAKVCRKGTIMVDKIIGSAIWGVYIDLFAIDGAPQEYQAHCRSILKKRTLLERICPYYKHMDKNKMYWRAKYLVKRIIYPYPGNCIKLKREIDNEASRYDLESSPLGGVVLGCYGTKEIIPSSIFLHYKEILFEGRYYSSICDTDTYLSAIYGDYMQLPPKEKQVTHHLYDAFIVE